MNKIPRWLIAVFAFTLIPLLRVGWWFYHAPEQRLRAEAEENLQSISYLKVAQIAQWRADRLAFADEILERPFTKEVIARWMVGPESDGTERILSWFRSLQKYHSQERVGQGFHIHCDSACEAIRAKTEMNFYAL